MENKLINLNKLKITFADKVVLVILIIVLSNFVLNRPNIKYFSIIGEMKRLNNSEYIDKIKVSESRSFKPIAPDSEEKTVFYVHLNVYGYSREQINQIGEELKIIIDNRLKTKNFQKKLSRVDTGIIYLILIARQPYPEWAEKYIEETRKYIWQQSRSVNVSKPVWDGHDANSIK
jgi:hypothetical protein